jgi:DNA polymerase-1
MGRLYDIAQSLRLSDFPHYDAFAFDTETHLSQPGNQTPRIVCVSTAAPAGRHLIVGLKDRESGANLVAHQLERAARGEVTIVGHNIAYDFGCLIAQSPSRFIPLVHHAMEAGTVYDTMIAEWLIDIAWGQYRIDFDDDGNIQGKAEYNLGFLANRYFGYPLDKSEDSWRMRYAELDGIDFDQWPSAAIEYPLNDARATYLVMHYQLERAALLPGVLDNLPAQIMNAWGRHMVHCSGFPVDQEQVQRLDDSLVIGMAKLAPDLLDDGFLKWKHKTRQEEVQRDMKTIRAAISGAYANAGRAVPMSDPSKKFPEGQVKTDAETLREAADLEDDVRLKRLWDFAHKQKIQSTFIEHLRGASIIHPGFGMAASGRSTSFSMNLQQLPREPGVRECFIPLLGNVLSSTDYGQLELCTFAQVLLWMVGESQLADAINAGQDAHVSLAAQYLGCDYDSAYKRYKAKDAELKQLRQMMKAPNFGYPGGMGWRKFVQFARQTYNLKITEQQSKQLKALWQARWPETKPYFELVGNMVGGVNGGQVTQFVSGRIRGGVGFTDACNTFFQGLAADGAQMALYYVVREMLMDTNSVLYGQVVRNFIHDEIIAEHPEEIAHESALRIEQIMVETMRSYVPDVKVKAEPCLMRRWEKAAEPMFDKKGRLVPWEAAA